MAGLTDELRRDIERRLAVVKKQIETLRTGRTKNDQQTSVHLYLVEREMKLREEQLERGRA